MPKVGSIEEVLEFAIEREIEANQLYLALAKCADNPNMKKLFEDFAKEELGHKAKLEAIKKSKELPPAEKVSNLKLADYITGEEPGPNMDYKDVLVLAMQKEKASYNLYTDLAGAVGNEAQKEAFLSLAQEEAKHKLRFEIEYDNVVLKED